MRLCRRLQEPDAPLRRLQGTDAALREAAGTGCDFAGGRRNLMRFCGGWQEATAVSQRAGAILLLVRGSVSAVLAVFRMAGRSYTVYAPYGITNQACLQAGRCSVQYTDGAPTLERGRLPSRRECFAAGAGGPCNAVLPVALRSAEGRDGFAGKFPAEGIRFSMINTEDDFLYDAFILVTVRVFLMN